MASDDRSFESRLCLLDALVEMRVNVLEIRCPQANRVEGMLDVVTIMK